VNVKANMALIVDMDIALRASMRAKRLLKKVIIKVQSKTLIPVKQKIH